MTGTLVGFDSSRCRSQRALASFYDLSALPTTSDLRLMVEEDLKLSLLVHIAEYERGSYNAQVSWIFVGENRLFAESKSLNSCLANRCLHSLSQTGYYLIIF